MEARDKFYRFYYSTQGSRYNSGTLKEGIKNTQWVLAREIIPLLPSDKKSNILELGCGYGSLLSLLKQHGYSSLKGIDISEEQVQIAKELGNNKVEQGDILSYLSNDAKTYDCIIGIDVIEHFEKDALMELLSMINARLNQNGQVILRTPNGDAPFGSTFYFGDFTHELILNCFSAEQVMLNADFQNVSILPSCVQVQGVFKNLFRSLLWPFVKLGCKAILFASGKTIKKVLFTPNLIITAFKQN